MDEQMIEEIAKAIEREFYACVDEGPQPGVGFERVARAAHSIIAEKVAELTEACGDALELLNRNIITPDALNAVGEKLAAALAPYPERRSE